MLLYTTGAGAHSHDGGVNRCTKIPAKASGFVLVPVLSVNQLGAGSWVKVPGYITGNAGQARTSDPPS